MIRAMIQQHKPMATLTPRDDDRKRVSEILKRVDQLIKAQEYEQAQRETERAKEIDPRNVYIDAYQERILALIEQAKRDREAEEAKRRAEEEERKRLEEERRKREEQLRKEEYERKLRAEEERRRQIELLQHKRLEEEARRRLEEERKPREELQPKKPEPILRTAQSDKIQGRVVLIDDDEKLLHLVKETIEDAGFEVLAFTTSDEAYKVLKTETPDLILSDINLETSTMGGFSFYEKIREMDHLEEVPFVFLSGLSDEVLVRTGKEMGIDDYITKPFSDQHLIAVIKGKIKRYRRIKNKRKKS
jgi:CheY-like chemotaxis protein